MSKQRKSTMPSVHAKPIQRKHAAGIDIGATSIYVAVPVDRDPQPVRSFQTFLGHYYRRMRAKLGAPKAITATAHKLARILYHLLTTGQPYQESIFEEREIQHQQRTLFSLHARARALGYQLGPLAPAT
jgi:hypothetical protein